MTSRLGILGIADRGTGTIEPAGNVSRGRKSLKLVTASTNAIVDTDDAKKHLRVSHANDNTLIDALVLAATYMAEEYTSRSFLTATWDYALDAAAIRSTQIELPRSPLSSITSISSIGDDNNSTTFSTSNYYTDTSSEPGRAVLVAGQSWPTDLRETNSLIVQFVAGWGVAIANVPTNYREWIRRAVLLTVGTLYENREDIVVGTISGGLGGQSLPASAKAVLQPLRIMNL